MPKEIKIIQISDSSDASYSNALHQYNACNHNKCAVVIDMCGRGINQHQSSILFGKLLIEYGYREIAVMRFNNTLENLNRLCQGISHFFSSKYPSGLASGFGANITSPQIEFDGVMGEGKYTTIRLGNDVFNAITYEKRKRRS